MRYTKTTAVLLAVSMFLAGCGGSTGIAASGAGMTAFMVPGTKVVKIRFLAHFLYMVHKFK